MKTDVPTCWDCSLEMETGFLVDFGGGPFLQSQWAQGPPEADRSFFGFASGVVLRDRRRYLVEAFRCPGCGQLKLYASSKADE